MNSSKNITDLFVLKSEEINAATEESYRQYFCGNLKKPQILDYISTEALEVGTSDYKEFTADTPHSHSRTADMIYILEGEFHVMILENGKSLILRKGDFISIPPKTPYASKAAAGTKTLFIKVTEGNDKIDEDVSDEVRKWLHEII